MEYDERILQKLALLNRCSLCSMLDDEEFEMLSRLQYDVTHDPVTRERIAVEGGFCEFHFRQFRKIANSKTHAILLLSLVKHYLASSCVLDVHCRLCDHLDGCQQQLIEDFARLFSRRTFLQVYEESPGLCRDHLAMVIESLSSPDGKELLLDLHRRQMERELRLLDEMASRSYYETSREARRSILRTVEKFVGRRVLSL
jgi:hypothetical protein